MDKRSNLMTRILIAVSCAAITAFACFSFYVGALQQESAKEAVKANISSSGNQAAQSVANWLNGRMMLTATIADEVSRGKADADALPVLANEVLAGGIHFDLFRRGERQIHELAGGENAERL